MTSSGNFCKTLITQKLCFDEYYVFWKHRVYLFINLAEYYNIFYLYFLFFERFVTKKNTLCVVITICLFEKCHDNTYRTKFISVIFDNNVTNDNLQEVKGDMLCNYKLSPHQVLYNLYRTIALTELKGYMMIQFSYMLLRLYNAGKV